MRIVEDFLDYELLDMASGEKLERWNNIILIRPDPQIIWTRKSNPKLWSIAHAKYLRSSSGGGHWEMNRKVPQAWQVKYKQFVFNIKPMGFKHTGLFPEQAVNWDYMINKIKKEKEETKRDIKVLNLFAYTGGATLACSYAGAEVCHVDSSKGMVNWAKENAKDSSLGNSKIRYIIDDTVKFVEREIRRGCKYDCIIMDPPSYGRGANGEVWSIEKDLYNLINLCSKLLSDNPLFFIVNTYTGGLSGTVVKNTLNMELNDKKYKGKYKVSAGEIGLKPKDSDIVLPCGVTTIWEKI